jgi:tetratricopeptide (TPR) repeat protein
MKSIKPIKLIAALALGITSLSSAASQYNGHYTLAVIKGSPIYSNISDGNYTNAISHLAKMVKQSPDERYENSMSLCAANIKLNDLTTASKACDQAVSMIDQTNGYKGSKKKGKYKALALNNRAIVKYFNDDQNGAYQDFNQALSLNNDPLIVANFKHFSVRMMDKQFSK